MDMNFTKAHHFSINGGNFGTVNGGVNNYTLTPGSLASPARLGMDSIATGLLSLPPSQGNNVDGAAIHSVPSTPATSHTNLSPASSTNNTPSPTSTTSTISSRSDYDFSSRGSSATPATDVEEPRHLGTYPFRPQAAQQPDPYLLTPLTDTLGLRRFTPGSHAATLSPYQTPLQVTAEFPGSPQHTGQVPTPPLPPQLPRTTPSNDQVPPLPSTPQPHQNTQFLDHNSPSSFDSSPISPRTVATPQVPADSDDPSVIFQRLRADTKGYANPLPHSNVFEYTPSPSQSARSLPRQAEVPQVDQAPEPTTPQSLQHWTPNVISDWTNHVREGDSGASPVHNYQNQSVPQHRASRPLPSPPVYQPRAPVNSFSYPQQPQQYPIHADVYHAPPFSQPQYQDPQPWPIFAPAMYPPQSFPPQHHLMHPNRLQYNPPQPAYHPATVYDNAPNFPMPLMG